MGGFLYYEVIEILQPLLLRGDVVGIDHVLLWSTFTATSVFASEAHIRADSLAANGRLERYGRRKIGDCMDLRRWHLNRGDEAISSPGNVDNEPISVSSVAEHSTQCRNMDGKVRGLDENIRPNPSHQF
jgi:hypothetical protein